MKLLVTRQAKQDIAETRRRYEEESPALGADFLVKLDEVFDLISRHPEMFARVSERVRRLRTERFPYIVYYTIDPGRIRVFAVLHAQRDEARWKSRL